MLGILLIDKPHGITSHDAVNQVRRKLGIRRVGHAGTLDPAATGLLVVAVGPATRFLQYLPLEPKEYVGTVTFGKETNTQDSDGEVLSEAPVPADLPARIEAILSRFRGLIAQVPPMYSAIKKAGKPLYVYAREGKTIERSARTVHIENIEVEEIKGHDVRVKVVCSGGTYMRTLAHDMGQAVGCGAYLSKLRRERVGRFFLGDAIAVSDVSRERLITLREALPPVPVVSLSREQAASVREGRAVRVAKQPSGAIAGLLSPEGSVIGVARILGNLLQPECVIPSEAMYDSA